MTLPFHRKTSYGRQRTGRPFRSKRPERRLVVAAFGYRACCRSFRPAEAGRKVLGYLLSGCSGDECGDDVGGVPVQGRAGAVISHRGSRAGVRGGFLDVPERDSGVERGGDKAWRSV
jgi:hypothetical protein